MQEEIINNNSLELLNIKGAMSLFLGKVNTTYKAGTLLVYDNTTKNLLPKADNLTKNIIAVLKKDFTVGATATATKVSIIIAGTISANIVESVNRIDINDVPTGAELSYFFECKNTRIDLLHTENNYHAN